MVYWTFIIMLLGIIIGIIIYNKTKNDELKLEIKRLRKEMVSGGKNFEQLEYRIENVDNYIKQYSEKADLEKLEKEEIENFFKQIDIKLQEVKKELLS